MNDDNHDDGLVHSHGWAKEPPPSIGPLLRAPTQTAPASPVLTPEGGCDAGK